MDTETRRQIEQIIGYHFPDPKLLEQAFIHSSSADNRLDSNERLEFLGDAILGLVISQVLFEKFPHYFEGDLTKVKSALVSRRTCAKIINEFGLQQYMKVGKGMDAAAALTGSIAAGLLEAIIGAIYLQFGPEDAKKFIINVLGPFIAKVSAEQNHGNFKSLLQKYAQQQFNTTPIYEMLDEKGPDHNKCFESVAVVANRYFKSAWGVNKKEAEQKAAYNALVELGLLNPEAEVQF